MFRKNVARQPAEAHLEMEFAAGYEFTNSPFEWDMLMGLLTETQRNVITKRFICGYSDIEIARDLGISRQAVNKAKRNALKSMKKALVGCCDV